MVKLAQVLSFFNSIVYVDAAKSDWNLFALFIMSIFVLHTFFPTLYVVTESSLMATRAKPQSTNNLFMNLWLPVHVHGLFMNVLIVGNYMYSCNVRWI